jgi:glutamyl-tRNA reductase
VVQVHVYRFRMLQELSFHVVGVTHHTAGVEVRERLAFNRSEIISLLKSHHQAARSALLLSTCNRCEFYWSGDEDGELWFRELARRRGAKPGAELTRRRGIAAIRHLFAVAAGLDSQILGESEILSQVRRAYHTARAAGTSSRDMDLIFPAALSAGRRVRRETLLGRHPSSVSSAAVDFIAKQRGGLDQMDVVVLGAGQAAEAALRALRERGAASVSLLNRHPDRARLLASAWNADIGVWSELPQRLERADLLIVAIASARPVVTAAQLSQAVTGRAGRPLFVLDLGVPRNVDPEARAVDGIRLFDLDDLQRLCCPIGAGADASVALAEAERVIDDELVRLDSYLRARIAAPRLAELHRLGLEMAEQESARALAELGTLSEPQQLIVREMAERLVRRVLYPVSRNLRQDAPPSDSGDGGSEVKNRELEVVRNSSEL